MKYELNKKNIILAGIFIILVIIFGLVYSYRYPNPTEKEKSKQALLTDYNRFFTVSNCADTFVGYLAKKDADSLYLLLSERYKIASGINPENILNKLSALPAGEFTFSARKIYAENLSPTIIKYYVYGYLKENIINTYVKPNDYYLLVMMDTTNFTYSIEPYGGQIFKENS